MIKFTVKNGKLMLINHRQRYTTCIPRSVIHKKTGKSSLREVKRIIVRGPAFTEVVIGDVIGTLHGYYPSITADELFEGCTPFLNDNNRTYLDNRTDTYYLPIFLNRNDIVNKWTKYVNEIFVDWWWGRPRVIGDDPINKLSIFIENLLHKFKISYCNRTKSLVIERVINYELVSELRYEMGEVSEVCASTWITTLTNHGLLVDGQPNPALFKPKQDKVEE